MYGVVVALIVRSPPALAIARRLRRPLDVAALVILWAIVADWNFSLSGGFNGPAWHSLFGIMCGIVILRVFTYEASLFNAIWRNSILAKIGLISTPSTCTIRLSTA